MIDLETFLQLVDRVIQLAGFRIENRRQLFTEIVEPLFHELEPLVDDYFLLFRDAYRKAQASTQSELRGSVGKIRDSRERLWYARTKVVEMAKAMRVGVKDDRLVDFAERVAGFFYSSQFEIPPKMSTAGRMVELCDYVLEEKLEKKELLDYIEQTQKELQDSWIGIVQIYGHLRLYCLRYS